MTQQQKDFFNLIKPGAVDLYYKYGILPSLTISQAILESGWGTSVLATQANNLFGIKWSSDSGFDKFLKQTTDFKNNEWIIVEAYFRKYNTIEESLEDYGAFLQKPRYAKVLTATDYKEAAYEVWQAGYATDPMYPEKLTEFIERYELYAIDNLVKRIKDYVQISDWAKSSVLTAVEKGIMIGDDQGLFNPAVPITRQEMAVVASRLLDMLS